MAERPPECTTKDNDEVAVTGGGSRGNIYLLSYGFNQDCTCFVCGTTAGFRVFAASPVREVHRREHAGEFQNRSVALIAMLYRTNLFPMVTLSDDELGSGGQSKVKIWNDKTTKFDGEMRSRNEVKGVAIHKDIIAMICEYAIYVYTLDKLRVKLHLTTNANPRGLGVLASASDPWILACPGQSIGAVRVQVGQDDRATHVFTAHQTPLAALVLNASGTLVATASERGTVVKVFQRSDGQLLYRLRRSHRPAAISCLAFRHDDRFLAVGTSSSATVHIFKLDPSTAEDGENAFEPSPHASEVPSPGREDPLAPTLSSESLGDQIASQISKAVSTITSHGAAESVTDAVKGVMPKYFNDLRSFAHFRVPDCDSNGVPSVDARSKQARIFGPQLAFHKTENVLLVLHYSGMLYECSFKPEHDLSQGTQECAFKAATTWFAVRPDFKLQADGVQVATVAGGASENDEEAEEWQLLD